MVWIKNRNHVIRKQENYTLNVTKLKEGDGNDEHN